MLRSSVGPSNSQKATAGAVSIAPKAVEKGALFLSGPHHEDPKITPKTFGAT